MVADPRTDPTEDDDLDDVEIELADRDEELSRSKIIRDAVLDIYKEAEQGYQNQIERSDAQMDYWDVYNCKLGPKQFYSGNSKIFIPAVHNAINARKTRFTNQIFPVSGRYVEVTTEDGTLPHALIAIAEHYVRKAQLRTKVMPALMRNGDIEGQYNVYVSWARNERHVVQRITKKAMVDGIESDEDVEDVQEETITHGYPMVEVLGDGDVLIWPATCDTIDEAMEAGGGACILRRWSKSKLRKMIRDKEIRKDAGEKLIASMSRDENIDQQNKPKKMADAAGIRTTGTSKYALVYEIWVKLNVKGDRRICRAYVGGEKLVLSTKRNPFWSDHLPLISASVEKVQGSFKGKSKVEPVESIQYQANDACNEAMDSAAYALMPIVMTDPTKNPRIGSMILSMAAIWETDPQSTQFAKFPQLWKDGMEIVALTVQMVKETLGVNPAMITQGPQKAKRNQAEIANEQQVDILTTADAVTVVEEGILTPIINRMIELDHQYRDEDLTVRQYGEMGMRASMEKIPPVQFNRRYQFRWFGVEAARSAQQLQQQIAGMNVIRGIPPEQLGGYQTDFVPLVTQLVENLFGPRLAPLVFKSPEQQMPVPIEEEEKLLVYGYEVPTHQMDDDRAHIQHHTLLMHMAQASENVGAGVVKKIQAHLWAHMQQAQKKQAAAMQQQLGQVGAPGGAGPGMAGTPRPGAQPAQPRGGQGPPGMVHQDQMQDPRVMPRKM